MKIPVKNKNFDPRRFSLSFACGGPAGRTGRRWLTHKTCQRRAAKRPAPRGNALPSVVSGRRYLPLAAK
jgi:hypothetical protein